MGKRMQSKERFKRGSLRLPERQQQNLVDVGRSPEIIKKRRSGRLVQALTLLLLLGWEVHPSLLTDRIPSEGHPTEPSSMRNRVRSTTITRTLARLNGMCQKMPTSLEDHRPRM